MTSDKVNAIIQSPAESDRPTVVVVAESNMHTIVERCAELRLRGVKSVGCCAKSVVGMVCDDFLEEFEVVDPDGEFYREVREW